jgi:hypothetical protein
MMYAVSSWRAHGSAGLMGRGIADALVAMFHMLNSAAQAKL